MPQKTWEHLKSVVKLHIEHCFMHQPTMHSALTHPPYVLDKQRADAVLDAILTTSTYRDWHVYAVHVRTNHVHAVLESLAAPERVLVDLKSYASRKLNELRFDPPDTKRWARHGSKGYLKDESALSAAVRGTGVADGSISSRTGVLTLDWNPLAGARG